MIFNVGRMFSNRAFLSPDMEAFVGEGYRITYREANERANRFSSFLTQNGIMQGDRIAVYCKNNEHAVTAMLGTAKIGAITVFLNYRLQIPELVYIIKHCNASLMVYDGEFAPSVDKLRDQIPTKVFVRKGGEGSDLEFESILATVPGDEPKIHSGGDDPAVLMYTSGTTGKPKGATLSHNNMFWASIGLAHSIDYSYKYRFLSVAPLFHIGGLCWIMGNTHAGCTNVFMPDFDPAGAWKLIVQEKINFAMTVPTMLDLMLKVPDIGKMDFSSLKYLVCGGAPVPQSLIVTYKDMGIAIFNVYGATEYSGATTFWTADMPFEKSKTVGKAVFHGEVKVFEPGGDRELAAGEIGELSLLGPQVFLGYWDNDEATRNVVVDGYYRSGDLGKIDEEGFVTVVDRLKDMIISGGENIYPAEIEAVIQTHPDVIEVAVAGKKDEKWGEIPVAFVALREDANVNEAEIKELCKENLAGYKCVKEVRFVNAVPRNSLGKVLKRQLRDQLN